MSSQSPALQDLLARRLDLVARLSQATAALQRLQQTRASAEMDAQRCEIGLEGEGTGDMARDLLRRDSLKADLAEARERIDESEAGLERCEAEIAGFEQSLAETDRQIEAAARRQSSGVREDGE